MSTSLDLQNAARALGGEVSGGQIECPGPMHSAKDRSLRVKLDASAPDGFIVHPNSPSDDPIVCRDHVRQRLGLPAWKPKIATAKVWQEFVYKDAKGRPYLRVQKTPDKSFPQSHWTGSKWERGKPAGPKIPYRLPGLLASPDAPVLICEGEKDADALVKLGFTGTTSSEGAGKWTPDLNAYFEGRTVYILPDNDVPGADHALAVAKQLDPVAADVRIVNLPGLPPKGDVSDWIAAGGNAEALKQLCEAAPVFLFGESKSADAFQDTAGASPSTPSPNLIFFNDQPLTPTLWTIEGLIPETGLVIAAGQSGAGKSYVVIDAALSVMTGLPFAGCNVKRTGGVLFLAAEGETEVMPRMVACCYARLSHMIPWESPEREAEPLAFMLPERPLPTLPFCRQAEGVPKLSDKDALPKLVELAREASDAFAGRFGGKQLAMIVIDTMSAAAGFGDENSASETQAVVNALHDLSRTTGAVVVVVDHYGKTVETGIRGSSAKHAGAEIVLAIKGDKHPMTGRFSNCYMQLEKSRVSRAGKNIPYELTDIEINRMGDTNAFVNWDLFRDRTVNEGEPTLVEGEPPKSEPAPTWTGKFRLLRDCIKRMLIEHAADADQQPFGIEGPRVKAVHVARVKAEFQRNYAAETPDAKRVAFNRALADAASKGLIKTYEIGASGVDWVWILKD